RVARGGSRAGDAARGRGRAARRRALPRDRLRGMPHRARHGGGRPDRPGPDTRRPADQPRRGHPRQRRRGLPRLPGAHRRAEARGPHADVRHAARGRAPRVGHLSEGPAVTLETEPGDPGPDLGPIPTELRESQAERLAKAWETPKGWRYWSAVHHTESGVWYAAGARVL